MKANDKKDLHARDIAELTRLFKDAQKVLGDLKLQKEQNILKNTSSLGAKRKEIAVIKTILKMKKGGEK